MPILIRLPFNSNGLSIPVTRQPGIGSHAGALYTAYDFALPAGYPVRAVAPGVIVDIRKTVPDGGSTSLPDADDDGNPLNDDLSLGSGAIGNLATVRHNAGTADEFYATYMHLQEYSVGWVIGQSVEVGDVLGLVGNTGARGGTHLHFQVGATLISFGTTNYDGWSAGTDNASPQEIANATADFDGAIAFQGYRAGLPATVVGNNPAGAASGSIPTLIEIALGTYFGVEQLASLGNRSWVVVWSAALDAAGSLNRIYFQNFGSDGVTRSAGSISNGTVHGNLWNPSVTALQFGGWLVAWQSHDGTEYEIHQQAFNEAGDPIVSDTFVTAYVDYLGPPQVAALDGGGWVITWQTAGGASPGLFQQRYSDLGIELSPVTLIHTSATGSETGLRVTSLDGGGWVVTWQSGSSVWEMNVYQRVYDGDGNAVGHEVQVNTNIAGKQQYQQAIALEGGGWVVVWWSLNQDGSGWGVFQQAHDSVGLTIGSELQVNTYTLMDQSMPQAVALEGGGWVVTWESTGQDGSGSGVFQQQYSSTGIPIGGEVRVNTTTDGHQHHPKIAALDDGGWAIVWWSRDSDGWGVFQQTFSRYGARVGAETRVNQGDGSGPASSVSSGYVESSGLDIAALPGGGWVVTWDSGNDAAGGNGIWQRVFQQSPPVPLESFRYPVGDTGVVTETGADNDGWYSVQDLGTRYYPPDPSDPTHEYYHLGEDWNAPHDADAGKPVYAIASGQVVYRNENHSGFGKVVVVEHELPGGLKVYSLYAHLQEISTSVNVGEAWNGPHAIGKIGNSGPPGTPNHLHIEVFEMAEGTSLIDYLGSTGLDGHYGYSHDPRDEFNGGGGAITNFYSYSEAGFTWYNPSMFIDRHRGRDTSASVADEGGDIDGTPYHDNWTLNTDDSDTTVGLVASGIDVVVDIAQGGKQFVVKLFETIRYVGGVAIDILNIGNLSGTTIQPNTIYFDGGEGNDIVNGAASSHRVVANGGAGNDLLTGGTGNDTLNGGLGADRITGGAGNDTFFVDVQADQMFEAVGGGADRVIASASYQLASGQEIETLDVVKSGAITAINLTGNGFGQTLLGNAGANVLNGKGGNDIMQGLGGNDTYYVDGAGDQVIEAVGGGSDRIIVTGSSSVTLAAGVEIERIETLTTPSLNSVNFTGNAFVQALIGNNGNNVLNGKGGADLLRGNGGLDAFLFDTALGSGNVDRILDFNVADDTIRLENLVFIGVGNNGTLNANFFHANATGTAVDADDRIICETDTGKLFFDADGSGNGAAVQFATVAANLAMSNAEFLIV